MTAPTGMSHVGSTGMVVSTMRDNTGTIAVVPATPDRVWAALPAVYHALEIPIGTMDSGAQTIGNTRHTIRGKLGGQAISRYVRCGNDAFGRPLADSYSVQFSIMTYLIPQEDGSTHTQTRVSALAADRSKSTDPVECSTTGRLENRMAELLGTILATAP